MVGEVDVFGLGDVARAYAFGPDGCPIPGRDP
jgi:hypothetical protein